MLKAEEKIKKICAYLSELRKYSESYYNTLSLTYGIYEKYLHAIQATVQTYGKTDWNQFTPEEKRATENCSYLVGLLYNMCKIELVIKSKNDDDINEINRKKIDDTTDDAMQLLTQIS